MGIGGSSGRFAGLRGEAKARFPRKIREKEKEKDLLAFSRETIEVLKGEWASRIEEAISSPRFPGAPLAGDKKGTKIRDKRKEQEMKELTEQTSLKPEWLLLHPWA